MEPCPKKDFFISHAEADQAWAEWIGWHLEKEGYSCILQAWDFRPGGNFVIEMDRAAREAQRTIAVLSPDYLTALSTQPEWAASFVQDPTGKYGKLVPVRVCDFKPDGLFATIIPIDLFDLDASVARSVLFEGVKQTRLKPSLSPGFPGKESPPPDFPGWPRVWNIPFPRNPFFTGRDQELKQLHDRLHQDKTAAIGQMESVSGLGGIGKTQLAIEYAYRYHDEYQYVLWARAETTQTLTSSFAEIANLLDLPEKDAEEQAITIQAVKRWLQQQRGWLLILDNADSPALLPDFLLFPIAGHLLITTRAAEVNTHLAGMAHPLAVETFSDGQGAYFLLQRSGLIALDATLDQVEGGTWKLAKEIAHELGGLPLALDQAGAYLKATGSSLSTYQQIYQRRRIQLLSERRGSEHPESVATTWDISFSKVEQQHPAAADLLCLCAFLAPDAIPEEIFTEGAKELGPTLAPVAADAYLFNQAIESLCAYSLVTRDPQERTLTVHRLVQAVLRDKLSFHNETRKQWMQRAVYAVNAAYPELDFTNGPTLERLLPHVLICALWIGQARLATGTTMRLTSEAGHYLKNRVRYKEAEPLLELALLICEEGLGATHPNTATSLINLALLYRDWGQYETAEPLLLRALSICEEGLGATHPGIASSLNALALLYETQGRYGEAEPLLQRALSIYEQQSGATHLDIAQSLNNLAGLYCEQGRYGEAEPLLQRALSIQEQRLGATRPGTASVLNNLAELYRAQERYNEAEPLYQRALSIYEQLLGATHPNTATSLHNLALLYRDWGQDEEAELLLERALSIFEQQLGATHPNTILGLRSLAALYYDLGKYREAGPLYQRALSIYEQQLGREHPTSQLIRKYYDNTLMRTMESEKKRKNRKWWSRLFSW